MRDLSKRKSIVVLVSGGADSAVLLHWALKRYRRVCPVYVKQGYRWERAEIYWLKKFLKKAGIGKKPIFLKAPLTDVLKNHWSLNGKKVPGLKSDDREVYLPGRNLFLLSKTALFCARQKIGAVAVGTLKGNPFRDADASYFRGLEKIFRQSLGYAVKIKSPFISLKKGEVLSLGRDLPLHLTFSCLNPRGIRPCGRCNKCAERARVFGAVGP